MNRFKILGIDPGKVNAAYAVIEVQAQPFRYRILEHGMLLQTLTSMVGSDMQVRADGFKREVRKIIRKHKPTHLIAERYQTRGPKGTNVELVNVMLGLLLSVGIRNTCLITASQWKNRWNKVYKLNDFYEEAGVVVHQIDAVNIAFYGASVWFELPFFQQLGNMDAFIKKLRASDIGNNKQIQEFHRAKKRAAAKKPKRRSRVPVRKVV